MRCSQVEFRYLSKITGDPVYAQKANKVFDIMSTVQSNDGLYPIFINPSSGKPLGSQVGVVLCCDVSSVKPSPGRNASFTTRGGFCTIQYTHGKSPWECFVSVAILRSSPRHDMT